jgi:hypothetical protein
MKTSVATLLALTVLVLCTASVADVPELINYQGILTDSGGSPLDGSYDLTFKVYPDSGAGAAALWIEQHIGVDVDEGLFNVILGANSPITAGLFSGPERWMGITVDADPEMYPRMRITSVPWALRAAVADSALNATGTGDGHSLDADDGDPVDAVYVDSDGKVGINTTTIGDFQLFVNGDVGIPYEYGYQISSYDAISWDSATGSIRIGTSHPGLLFYAGDVQPRMAIDRSTGNVGIGTPSPSQRLDVAGTAEMDGFRLTTGAATGRVLTSNASGFGTWQPAAAMADSDWVVSGEDIYSYPLGNVGIGDMSPEYKLDVHGDINSNDEYKLKGYTVLHTDGISNIALGQNAGEYNTSWGCAFMGRSAGRSNQGHCNTFVGVFAGTTSTGGANTFVGFNAGNANASGEDNTFLGYYAGDSNTEGNYNTFLGHQAGTANDDGVCNTMVGSDVGEANTSGSNNAFMGFMTGYANTTGEDNVFLGTRAGRYNVSGSRNVFLGNRAGYNETGSDKLYIANGQYDSDVLIYGDFANKEVGIGTLDPASDLEIYRDADDFVGLYITNPNTGISSSEGIYFENEDGTVAGIRFSNADRMSVFNNRPDGYICWSTAGSQRMVVTNGGNVGIGTGSPENLFHVDGVVQIGSIETISDIGANTLGCNSNWYPEPDGSWGLGASGYRWSEVWAVDGTINTSDMRLKEGIRDLDYGLDEVMELKPVSFTWRDRPEAGTRLGLIAQDVKPVMSEVVADRELVVEEGEYGPEFATKPAENLGIYYNQLIPVLIKAVQEQQGMIADQAERIAELEARIAEIEN